MKPCVLSREWRCSWSSADRRCSNYIWVIDNFIACKGAPYIRDLTVVGTWPPNKPQNKCHVCILFGIFDILLCNSIETAQKTKTRYTNVRFRFYTCARGVYVIDIPEWLIVSAQSHWCFHRKLCNCDFICHQDNRALSNSSSMYWIVCGDGIMIVYDKRKPREWSCIIGSRNLQN